MVKWQYEWFCVCARRRKLLLIILLKSSGYFFHYLFPWFSYHPLVIFKWLFLSLSFLFSPLLPDHLSLEYHWPYLTLILCCFDSSKMLLHPYQILENCTIFEGSNSQPSAFLKSPSNIILIHPLKIQIQVRHFPRNSTYVK